MGKVMARSSRAMRQDGFRQGVGLVKSLLRGEAMSSQDDAHAGRWFLLWLNEAERYLQAQPTPADSVP